MADAPDQLVELRNHTLVAGAADEVGGDVATAVAEAVASQQDLALRTIRLAPTPGSPLR